MHPPHMYEKPSLAYLHYFYPTFESSHTQQSKRKKIEGMQEGNMWPYLTFLIHLIYVALFFLIVKISISGEAREN